jgi:hypothetical protein
MLAVSEEIAEVAFATPLHTSSPHHYVPSIPQLMLPGHLNPYRLGLLDACALRNKRDAQGMAEVLKESLS